MAKVTKAELEKENTRLNDELDKYRQWLFESEKNITNLLIQKKQS